MDRVVVTIDEGAGVVLSVHVRDSVTDVDRVVAHRVLFFACASLAAGPNPRTSPRRRPSAG